MSTTDWIQPGASAFLLTDSPGSLDTSVTAVTIERTTKTQVIIADSNKRFRFASADADGCLNLSPTTWGARYTLAPVDDPQSLRLLQKQRIRNVRRSTRQRVVKNLEDFVSGDDSAAEKAIATLQLALDNLKALSDPS